MVDRTTRILLALIAAGLWANAVFSAMTNPASVQDAAPATNVFLYFQSIDKNIASLASGSCSNRRLC